jgi:hypothetical protein
MTYRTCKRCSVTRVNVLCELYQRAFVDGDVRAGTDLAKLTALATERGYRQGSEALQPGLSESTVRSLCWNISSLLEDEDLARLGYNSGGK